jgi:hypothetical protein
MKSTLHSLIPFLPLFSITFDCRLSQFSAATASYGTQLHSNSSCVRSSLRSLGQDPTENTTFSIVASRFTAAEMCLPHSCVATSAARTHWQRRLQHLFYCCVTSPRTWRVPLLRVYGPPPSNDCSSASTVLVSSKYGTIWCTVIQWGCSKINKTQPPHKV